jgi:DedD protein
VARERAKVRFELSRPALGLAALALVVALTWMFALGVFIGRRYSPDTYLPPPPPPPARPAQAVAPPAPPPAPAAEDAAQPAAQQAAPEASTEAKGPADARFAEEMARQKRQADAATTPQAKGPERKPGSKKAEPARQAPDAYAAQVGAFGDAARAQAMVAELNKQGYRAFVFLGNTGPRYRVRLGPYERRAEAEAAAAAVGRRLGIKPYMLEVNWQVSNTPVMRHPTGPGGTNWKLLSP